MIQKINTGISAELIAAAELARRDFSVAITLGNTKKIDLMVEKNGISRQIQVKGIKQRKNNNFRIKIDSLREDCFYIFVNVNRVNLELSYEIAILTYSEVINNLRRDVKLNDNAIKTSILDNIYFKNNWGVLDVQ
jgi:hypothetical protein